jgi:hypothetical protein
LFSDRANTAATILKGEYVLVDNLGRLVHGVDQSIHIHPEAGKYNVSKHWPTPNIRHGSQPKAKLFIQTQPRKRRSRETVVITLAVEEEEGKRKGR